MTAEVWYAAASGCLVAIFAGLGKLWRDLNIISSMVLSKGKDGRPSIVSDTLTEAQVRQLLRDQYREIDHKESAREQGIREHHEKVVKAVTDLRADMDQRLGALQDQSRNDHGMIENRLTRIETLIGERNRVESTSDNKKGWWQ